MAKPNLPPVWRWDFGDYSGLGSVFQKFLANLNLFTLAVYNSLNGGLGFANLQRAIYTTTVTASATTTIAFVNPLAVAPSGLSLVQVLVSTSTSTPISSAISVANWTYDGKTITVLDVAGLTPGTSYQISLEVM